MTPHNYRDVGRAINSLVGEATLKEGVLLRGGSIDLVDDLRTIGLPKTIVNLRRGKNPAFRSTITYDLPAQNSVDVYSVERGFNRKWVVSVLNVIGDESVEFPLYLHCAFGRDRTGVIVGAILSALGVAPELIEREYAMSSGPLSSDAFKEALVVLEDRHYFRRVNVDSIRNRLMAS